MEEAGEVYVEYALTHPHEYELYYLHEYELLFSSRSGRGVTLNQVFKEGRPAVELVKGKLAAQLGGSPDEYVHMTLAVWALLHGTVMLLIAKTIHPEHAGEMREACRNALKRMLHDTRP
jgi:hypothetical protein